MNITHIDFKLLVVFDAIMAERHVTRAGRRIGLTQPAVSNALNRLRHLLEDDLFHRSAEGMQPTPRALELAAPVAQALRQLEAALLPATFDPATATYTFSFAMSDQVGVVLLPLLAKRLEETAPGIDLRILSKSDPDLRRQLEVHAIDFGVGVLNEPLERCNSIPLYDDSYVCVMRRDHSLARASISLEEFLSAKHLLVRSAGQSTSFIDRLIEKKGLKRRITMTMSQVLAVPPVIENSEMVTTLLRRTADRFRDINSLHIVPLPLELSPVSIGLTWHHSLTDHKAHVWMRSVLVDLCRKL